MRARIVAVGLLATAITASFTFVLWWATWIEYSPAFATVLAGAAIACPLFGTIAGIHSKGWKPLIIGCALGAVIMIAMYYVLRHNNISPSSQNAPASCGISPTT
jgi:hypothetical protein